MSAEKCPDIIRELEALARRDTDEVPSRITGHLTRCPGCLERLERRADLDEILRRALPALEPAGGWPAQRDRARARREEAGAILTHPAWSPRLRLGIAVAAALFFFAILVLFARKEPAPTQGPPEVVVTVPDQVRDRLEELREGILDDNLIASLDLLGRRLAESGDTEWARKLDDLRQLLEEVVNLQGPDARRLAWALEGIKGQLDHLEGPLRGVALFLIAENGEGPLRDFAEKLCRVQEILDGLASLAVS